jgi:predicted phosphodiesterase
MTKLAILSDIHANLPALGAVLEDMANFSVDATIVAGDVINFGPFTQQVVQRVIENNWAVIRGNGELFLLDYGTSRAPQEWNDPVGFPIPPWLNRQLNSSSKTTIAKWADTLTLRFSDAPPIRVVHGTPQSPWDSLYPTLTDEEITKLLADVQEETLIAGHTHLPMDRQSGRWHLLNPGSVGVPLDGQFTASYMLLNGDEGGWQPTFRRVVFDYESIFQEFERLGFVEECGAIGQLIIEVFKTARPQFGFLSWREHNYPNEPVSMELLSEYFNKCHWWEYASKAYHVNI